MRPGSSDSLRRLEKSSSCSARSKKSATRDRPEQRPKSFLQSVLPAVFREKKSCSSRKNVVYPVYTLQDAAVSSTVAFEAGTQDSTRPRASLQSSAKSYRIKIQALHGLDLLNPCCSSTLCTHTFLPIATITITSCDQGLKERRSAKSCQAAQHAQNHTLWNMDGTLEVSIPSCYPASSAAYQHQEDLCYSVSVTLTNTCNRVGNGSSMYIGETEVLRMLIKDEEYEIMQFFPVWRQLSSKSAIGPYAVGKIKLRIRFEIEKAAISVAPPPISSSSFQSGAAALGRPSFLPVNFADALNTKRKQLKATVALENISDTTQGSCSSFEFDAVASERILKEIASDPTLRHVPAHLVQFLNPVGEGIHSSVLHGRLTSQDDQSQVMDIAIKEFRYQHSYPPPKVLATFRREYQLLEKCTSEDAHHIVKYLGVLLTPRPAIIMEFFPSRSLAHCMQNEASWRNVSLLQKARIAVQIAEGLGWLHAHDIVHRDVKSHNILLDRLDSDVPVAKICDVGSAVRWRDQDPLLTEETGSSGYAAPEIFTTEGYSSKVDVWSFGIVLWELLHTGSTDKRSTEDATNSSSSNNNSKTANPFVGIANDKFVELARTGTRPICCFPSGDTHSQFEELLHKCWQFDPAERPTMSGVTTELHAISRNLSDQ